MSDLADLEARVARMRALGVTRWGDIELGPMPQSEATPIQHEMPDVLERRQRADQRMIALSAAAGLVPRLGEDRK